jgi:hypothetical protein
MTGYQRIVHIRVTVDALQGSPVSVPITPERARAIGRLMMVPGGSVVADPRDYETKLELLMHPADYCEVLKARPYFYHSFSGGVETVMGIPVER